MSTNPQNWETSSDFVDDTATLSRSGTTSSADDCDSDASTRPLLPCRDRRSFLRKLADRYKGILGFPESSESSEKEFGDPSASSRPASPEAVPTHAPVSKGGALTTTEWSMKVLGPISAALWDTISTKNTFGTKDTLSTKKLD